MSTDVDPITFEVIAHKFTQLTEEIASTLQRTSGSVVVTEGMDFGVVLADPSGAIFSVGDFATVHSTGLQAAIEWTIEHRSENPGIEDGDMFFLSDPWVGVVHQPDVAVLAPIFIEGRLYAWAASTMHMLDTTQIELIEGDRNYVKLTVGRETFHARSTLQQAEQAMRSEAMLRISRSCLVNTRHIREVTRTPRGDFILVLVGGRTVTSSEGFRDSVRTYLTTLKIGSP